MVRAGKDGGLQALGWVLGLALLCTPSGWAQSSSRRGKTNPHSKREVIVSIPDRKLAVLENGIVLRTFAVSVGAEASPSPTGSFAIVNRLVDPTYYHSGLVIPAGKDNPLGPRWVGLNKKGYGIHGTSRPSSIGKAASHGCIRLRNRDILELASLVKVGDRVEIRGARDEELSRIFGDEASIAIAKAQVISTTSVLGSGQ
jgi:hypothetical protein